MTQAFLTFLNSLYELPETKQATLIRCRWKAKKDQTVNIIESFTTNYESNAMEYSVGFTR